MVREDRGPFLGELCFVADGEVEASVGVSGGTEAAIQHPLHDQRGMTVRSRQASHREGGVDTVRAIDFIAWSRARKVVRILDVEHTVAQIAGDETVQPRTAVDIV